jgi:hypothetical protein
MILVDRLGTKHKVAITLKRMVAIGADKLGDVLVSPNERLAKVQTFL